MREVKEICELLLDTPAPPATTPADLLGMARARIRRTRLLIAGGVTAIVTSAAAIAVPLASPQTAPPLDPGPSVSASPSLPPVHTRFDDPVLRQMMAALEAIRLPEGVKFLDYGAGTSLEPGGTVARAYSVEASFTKDSLATLQPAHQVLGGIEIRRFREPRDPAFQRNPCRTDRMRELGLGPSTGCTFADGVAVGEFQRAPEVRFAVRHADDWTILVRHDGNVLSDVELAQIVLNPAFAP